MVFPGFSPALRASSRAWNARPATVGIGARAVPGPAAQHPAKRGQGVVEWTPGGVNNLPIWTPWSGDYEGCRAEVCHRWANRLQENPCHSKLARSSFPCKSVQCCSSLITQLQRWGEEGEEQEDIELSSHFNSSSLKPTKSGFLWFFRCGWYLGDIPVIHWKSWP